LTNITNNCPPTLLQVTEDLLSLEDEGDIVTIPFISDESQWGKDVNETGIVLNMWLPKNYKYSNNHGNHMIKYDDHLNACYLEYELDEEELLHTVEDDMKL